MKLLKKLKNDWVINSILTLIILNAMMIIIFIMGAKMITNIS